MYRTLKLSLLAGASFLAAASSARAEESAKVYVDDTSVVGLWEDATKTTIGQTAEYTNSVELADINGDGMVVSCSPMAVTTKLPASPSSVEYFLTRAREKCLRR